MTENDKKMEQIIKYAMSQGLTRQQAISHATWVMRMLKAHKNSLN